ncbi:hypothetical protein EYC84_003560 [Monilinia fructicola]|uniref:Uncharacterized protein n=1 Tax=Monilinia fructicola TaxID=38448 RepID=A0A5M9JWI7_MONFR|nr:hypothetical protein EYC84_003560 [Monilinia fructicola]
MHAITDSLHESNSECNVPFHTSKKTPQIHSLNILRRFLITTSPFSSIDIHRKAPPLGIMIQFFPIPDNIRPSRNARRII